MKIDERKIRLSKAQGKHNLPLQAQAEALAVAVLSFVASDQERLERFVALSGLDLSALRSAASEPGFLPGVLDYVAGDETLLLAFANAQTCDPADIMRARMVLGNEHEEMP